MRLDVTKPVIETANENEPAAVEIHDRAGNTYSDESGENPSRLLVLGEYSDVIREYDRRATNRGLRTFGEKMTAEQLDERVVDRLTAAVVGWENVVGDFSKDAVRQLLRDQPWTRNDVIRGMTQHHSFFSGRSANS
jgi:hypothetical protein